MAEEQPDLAEDALHFQLIYLWIGERPHLNLAGVGRDEIRNFGAVAQHRTCFRQHRLCSYRWPARHVLMLDSFGVDVQIHFEPAVEPHRDRLPSTVKLFSNADGGRQQLPKTALWRISRLW